MPERIQLRRTKGWRKPEGAIVVSRPSVWANPFPIDGEWMMWTAVAMGGMAHRAGRREAAVALHRAWMTGTPIPHLTLRRRPTGGAIEFSNGRVVSEDDHLASIAAHASMAYEAPTLPERPDLTPLRGHDLACWCPLDQPCHADVLLELANRSEPDVLTEVEQP